MSSHTDTERLPDAPLIPERDILVEIFDRVTLLSDEINDPDGILAVSLRLAEATAVERHRELKTMMEKVLNEVFDVRARVDVLEEESEHDNRITVQ